MVVVDLTLMGCDGLGAFDVVIVTHSSEEVDVLGLLGGLSCHVDKVVRESRVEVVALLDVFDVLGGELEAESLDVGFEMVDLGAADERKHVGRL